MYRLLGTRHSEYNIKCYVVCCNTNTTLASIQRNSMCMFDRHSHSLHASLWYNSNLRRPLIGRRAVQLMFSDGLMLVTSLPTGARLWRRCHHKLQQYLKSFVCVCVCGSTSLEMTLMSIVIIIIIIFTSHTEWKMNENGWGDLECL